MKRKTVTMKALLVTFDKYPDIDAGAIRVHMFARILKEAGYETTVISMGKSTGNVEVTENDEIHHISFRGEHDDILHKATYYLKFPLKLYLYLKEKNFDVILHTQLDVNSLRVLQSYSFRKKIPIIYDSVEWFSESQFRNGKRARAYKRNNRYNLEYIQSPEAVIAISTYLENHFLSRGISTVRIPVIMNTVETEIRKEPPDNRVTVLYAGRPGKKDYLVNIINGLTSLSEQEKERIAFKIAGCTEDQLIEQCGVERNTLEQTRICLKFLGKIPREQVLEEYQKADFSALIRPANERYAQAGFPTKFVESMCCSTPVICNITSDLGMYARDGINSIIVNDISSDEIAKALRRVISLSYEEKSAMRINARKTATECFDYKIYADDFMTFVNQLKAR